MARPQRNNVDYFPFLCEEGKKMFYLEETYGNDGFATFVKILRELAKTNYHYLDLSKNTTMMFLSAKCKVSQDVLNAIILDLVDLEKFDSVLWNENKIIWCQDFIDSIEDAYIKRKNKCITYDGLILLLISLGVRKPNKREVKGVIKPQSIVEYSKEDNSIKKENTINQEFLKMVCDFFSQTTEPLNRKVWGFMNNLNNNGKFEEFVRQTNAYIKYKKQSDEKIHSWLGYESEWKSSDYVDKLSKITKPVKKYKPSL